ncbi:type II toxin-antitoxin system RelE/ParE family toxin [Anabaena sp. FACHB-1237]|uniref:type II toxin-antitoxin system RelE/ParE family toxin n=1 Tax=Anabaena sp. FACHB-1237 TaxID=2692769 RepID=UPI0018EFAE66|nr:type II toxin-antitoxin system RelE/ParE family toxin [Anabaena sp. FACHB-1237]
MGKDYSEILSNLRGFIVDDYIVFYYPLENGIEIVRVVYGKRDLNAVFEEFGKQE